MGCVLFLPKVAAQKISGLPKSEFYTVNDLKDSLGEVGIGGKLE